MLILFCMAALAAFPGHAGEQLQIGQRLPELRGEFLTERKAVLPEAASGRTALLLLGFTYDSRFAVEDWAKHFGERFRGRPDVTFYEIPMIGGIARLGKWFIDSGMRKGTPREAHENVITVYGGTDAWKKRTGYKDPKAAYLILINAAGDVVWRHQGGFDTKALDSLAAVVDGSGK
jgi:hypothetical protein